MKKSAQIAITAPTIHHYVLSFLQTNVCVCVCATLIYKKNNKIAKEYSPKGWVSCFFQIKISQYYQMNVFPIFHFGSCDCDLEAAHH